MEPGRHVAVVGSGIAGLAAAWLIGRRHRVDLYEAADRPGGHVNTVDVEIGGHRQPVDTGFIVHNPVNFPNLVALFRHLGVATEDSDMSFAVSARGGALEYAGGRGPRGLFAQPANLLDPGFLGMLRDILRFNRRAAASAAIDGDVTLADWLDREGFGVPFRDDHLLPVIASTWSASRDGALAFPAAALFRFFETHGLLRVFGRPRWRTVSGGCRTYVDALIRDFAGTVYLSTPVVGVTRSGADVMIRTGMGEESAYDAVVVATHADTALDLLADADDAERKTLGAFGYARNRAVLHRDRALMPRRRAAWASWNYLAAGGPGVVTYWMNRLQNIKAIPDLFVTLDPPAPPRDEIAAFDYAHPQFDRAAIAAQRDLPALQGARRSWFCGSYCGYGFHEDALKSAIRVAADFGVTPPWSGA